MNRILKIFISSPRNVFLLDGIGAMVSAWLLVAVLAPFEHIFGMPKPVLYKLSVPVFVFMLYSLACYFIQPKSWKPWLTLIAAANFLYCCVTCALVIQLYASLTTLGILYFLGEIAVIFVVISIEIMTIRNNK